MQLPSWLKRYFFSKRRLDSTGNVVITLEHNNKTNKLGGIEMTNHTIDISQRKAARVAGFMFLFSLIVPLLNWIFVYSKLIVAENVIATANNIMANEFLFRIGIINDLITLAVIVVLSLLVLQGYILK